MHLIIWTIAMSEKMYQLKVILHNNMHNVICSVYYLYYLWVVSSMVLWWFRTLAINHNNNTWRMCFVDESFHTAVCFPPPTIEIINSFKIQFPCICFSLFIQQGFLYRSYWELKYLYHPTKSAASNNFQN
jgi:hypothetical protein